MTQHFLNGIGSSPRICLEILTSSLLHPLSNIFFLSYLELDKSSSDVAAEGAILNEMLDIVAKRAALRSHENTMDCDVSVVNSKAHSINRSNFLRSKAQGNPITRSYCTRSTMYWLCLQFVLFILCTYLIDLNLVN